MKKLTKWLQIDVLFLALALCSITAVVAKEIKEKEDKSPLGCRDVGYRFTLKTLDILPQEVGEQLSLYFMFNETSSPIHLYQMRNKDDTDAMSLNHVIPPHTWAALSVDAKLVKYACVTDDKKTSFGKIVDCAESLKVCEFAHVKYGMNNRGNFWMVNGNTKGGAVREVLNYGVIPR